MDKIETALNVGGLFTERINRFLGSVVDEIKQNLDNGLQAYTNTMYAKINKVKTFIYRENSVDFYSIYFPLILKNGKDKYVKVPLNVEKLFSSCNYLTILGRAGSGKTMLMRHCFLSVLKTSSRIPIIIELRELNHFEGSLYEYISHDLWRQEEHNGHTPGLG